LKKEYHKYKITLPHIICEEKQKEIIKQSFLLRKESKELIEKAKKEIEEYIEENN